jgi:hypothetical protein
MLGEAKFKARPTTPRTTSLPVVREGRLPTIPLHPPGIGHHQIHPGDRAAVLIKAFLPSI